MDSQRLFVDARKNVGSRPSILCYTHKKVASNNQDAGKVKTSCHMWDSHKVRWCVVCELNEITLIFFYRASRILSTTFFTCPIKSFFCVNFHLLAAQTLWRGKGIDGGAQRHFVVTELLSFLTKARSIAKWATINVQR